MPLLLYLAFRWTKEEQRMDRLNAVGGYIEPSTPVMGFSFDIDMSPRKNNNLSDLNGWITGEEGTGSPKVMIIYDQKRVYIGRTKEIKAKCLKLRQTGSNFPIDRVDLEKISHLRVFKNVPETLKATFNADILGRSYLWSNFLVGLEEVQMKQLAFETDDSKPGNEETTKNGKGKGKGKSAP
ncbi:MAG: hypothetical protein M1834_004667 [Cirrosporium novae-zelandiae]|nr:MAG: hypothetical protein M1834_004667 [Cirrosporium novae-zelandiae]